MPEKEASESYELFAVDTKKESSAVTTAPTPSSGSIPTVSLPAAVSFADKQIERTLSVSRRYSSFPSATASATSVLPKPDPVPVDPKPQTSRKARYLQLAVIIAVIVAFLLIIGLSIVLYFALSTHTGSKVWTAHELCQAKYGQCSMFAGETALAFPSNCSIIPCQYRCYIPKSDLNGIDPLYRTSDYRLFVSGRDGLICHSHSLCKDNTCVHTSERAYDQRVDPKSAAQCIKTMYGGTTVSSSGCLDSQNCHRHPWHLCLDKDQIQIGFKISCSDANLSTCTNIQITRCGTGCDVDRERVIKELDKINCSLNRTDHECSWKCKGAANQPVSPGAPCTNGRKGYCWRGRCFESERFGRGESVPGLIGERCYAKSENMTCYYDPRGTCANLHLLDRYQTSMTRYGYDCFSWDRNDVIPKRYHKLKSYGCILHDKKMPWCYSTNPNVIWNYCYNLCPPDKKDTGSIRVMTFALTAHNVNIKETAKGLADHIRKINPDIILASVGVAREIPEWKKNINKATGGEWEGCGGLNSIGTHSIFIRNSTGTTINLSGASRSAGCMVVKVINDRTQDFAVIATDLLDDNKSPVRLCNGSQGGGYGCKDTVPKCEALRINRTKSLIAAVRHQLDNFATTNIILGGSFNQPSHLDWTPEAAHLHCNTTYNWTISKLMQQAGYKDSYRHMWKDPSLYPGITWSPLHDYDKYPKDRLDYIYFRGPSVRPIRANTYPVSQPGKGFIKDWPSDRYAVVVDYQFK